MRLVAGLAATTAALLMTSAAHATIIYQTDFEAPTYSTGLLGGQNGWSTFGSGSAVMVDDGMPIDGVQSAKITGALAGGQSGPYHTNPSGIAKVTVSADILLTHSTADRGWQFSAIGPSLLGFTGGIDVDANTNAIRAITSGFTNIGTFSRDTKHRVDILLDYGAQTFGVKLDGATLASGLAFCGDNGPCAGAPTPGYSTVLFDTFGVSGADAGYLDNILVQSTPGVPEPSAWALSLLGFGLLGAALRRRAPA
ncbi:PEPxxWA-CTERM sorting domain-containing protein [Phenylobacterium sp.]|uniref:PEPxxWA-CTERM sorting domain-containing protein n=1 Tax=Phenylobacterium sp. TaxID=1871053 RepID=UPI0025EF6F0E|nr:PEPxxWA-CTERM sorting domain-containing protein [Phenylobacterium sp.]